MKWVIPSAFKPVIISAGNLGVNGECEMAFYAPELKHSSITAACSISSINIEKAHANRLGVSERMLGLGGIF